ncbi:MAG TPA: TonB-dependent receptor [Rhodothermales bacterium]|nr:TonB-dependent receptor [Rhodothermales bacterium]
MNALNDTPGVTVLIFRKRFALSLLLLLAGTGSVFAQATLRGVVRDGQTRHTLPGANVFVVGTSLGNATDVEGAYRISGIPLGMQTIQVSFLSYETTEIQVDLTEGGTVEVDFTLLPAFVQGELVTVTGQAEGQAAAINRQLTSNTIVNVVSEEKIRELPDANAAEAIGRLPGVSVQRSGGEANRIVLRGLSDRFTAITVDGVRIASTGAESRGVDLSTMPQSSLAGIELYKALTSDQDADAIAGSVNLVTKKAPSERLVQFDVKGAYSGLTERAEQFDLAIRYGERFLDQKLGVQITGNLERRDRSNENLDLDYTQFASGTNYRITDVQLNYTDEIRRRNGASLLLDYDTPAGGTIRVTNIYYKTERDFIDFNRNYPTDGEEIFYGARDREQSISSMSSALRGENYFWGLTGTWGISYSRSKSDYPFDYDVDFTEPSATDSEGNVISGMQRIPTSLDQGPAPDIIDYAANNFDRAFFYSAFYRDEAADEKEWTGYLNLENDYALSTSLAGQLKFGGKYRTKSRFRDRLEILSPYYIEAFPRFVRNEDGTISEKSFDGTEFDGLNMIGDRILANNFLGGAPESRDVFDDFRLNPVLDRDALRAWWRLNQNGFSDLLGANPEYERNLEADGDFYDVDERIGAAYVMNRFVIGRKVNLITGVRIESEDDDYGAKYSPRDLSGFPVPTGAIRDTSASHTETVWLPNVHLTFRPTGFLGVRLAAYKALARPSFNQRLPTYVARKAGTFYPGNSLLAGNPNLKAAEAWNYEINTSLYEGRYGLFSVSLFYKDVKGMYHLIDGAFFDAASGDALLDSLGLSVRNPFQGQGFALTHPYNSSRPTYVWGVELEHQTNLRFLPSFLSHLVLGYNFSVIRSETYVPGTETEEFFIERPPLPPIPSVRYLFVERKQKLEGQPEFLGNVALGYDLRGFSIRLSVAHQGEYNTRFSPDGRDDRVEDSFTRWDLAVKQQILDNIHVVFNLNNVTGVEEGTTVVNRVQDWRLRNDSETYGFSADFGVRITL